MRADGWAMLILSWGAILVLSGYTLWRTIRSKPHELSAPLELEAEIEEMEARKDPEEA